MNYILNNNWLYYALSAIFPTHKYIVYNYFK